MGKKGFRFYGFVGIAIIILAEVNFFLKLQPFANWYFPIIWFGYILLMDALIYSLKKSSIIMNNRKQFFLMLALPSIVWWGFEIINYFYRLTNLQPSCLLLINPSHVRQA